MMIKLRGRSMLFAIQVSRKLCFLLLHLTAVSLASCGNLFPYSQETSSPVSGSSLAVDVTYSPIPPRAIVPSITPTARPTATIVLAFSTSTPTLIGYFFCDDMYDDLPKFKKEYCDRLRATRVAHQKSLGTPNPSITYSFFDPLPTSDPEDFFTPEVTPIGDGYLIDLYGYPEAYQSKDFIPRGAAWIKVSSNDRIIVWAGFDYHDESQGMVIVEHERSDFIWPYDRYINRTPSRSGAVQIIDAVGSRLILESEEGAVFYFDVPSGEFANTLDQIIPSMTPAPTFTPEPTLDIWDDVPNYPYLAGIATGYRRANTELTYKIEKQGDLDWFLFSLEEGARVSVLLKNLSANYGFRVIRESDMTIIHETEEVFDSAKEADLGILTADVYAVVVYGIGGASDADNPYSLVFRVAGE